MGLIAFVVPALCMEARSTSSMQRDIWVQLVVVLGRLVEWVAPERLSSFLSVKKVKKLNVDTMNALNSNKTSKYEL